MRLLHVVPTYLPAWRHGGPILAIHGLCKALVARGHAVTVLTTDVHGEGRLDVPLAELCHIRGIAKEEEDCEPLMTVLGLRLIEHYALKEEPRIFLNGKPLPGR